MLAVREEVVLMGLPSLLIRAVVGRVPLGRVMGGRSSGSEEVLRGGSKLSDEKMPKKSSTVCWVEGSFWDRDLPHSKDHSR